jgi:hypothetical protein
VALVVVVPGPFTTPGVAVPGNGEPGSSFAVRRAAAWAQTERRIISSLASAVRAARGVLPATDRICVVETAVAFEAPHPEADREVVGQLLGGWWVAAVRAGQCPAPAGDPPHRLEISRLAAELGASGYFHGRPELPGAAAELLARYLTDRKLRHEVRLQVQSAILPTTRVVIGYGVGALMAYEALCALGDTVSVSLVTLGGALCGPDAVYTRLEPAPRDGQGHWPAAVHHWFNLVALDDLTAMTTPQLTDRFGAGIDDELIEIRAGYGDLHQYLLDRTTGRAVAAGLV